jgi:SAM-dependent methyltransferase
MVSRSVACVPPLREAGMRVARVARPEMPHHTMIEPGPSRFRTQLLDTQRAFDSVAADYDGPRGNNLLIQRMRQAMWHTVPDELVPGSRLLDLGCGTGIDAAEFARHGYHVLATDWSRRMVERTRSRALLGSIQPRLEVMHLGIHQLDQLAGEFDGIYSNFGPMNCIPDLAATAAQCARLLRPGGKLLCAVIGRICPWEIGHYMLRGRFGRAMVRAARGATPVGMNGHTIWAHYYLPREFYRAFAGHFSLCRYRALGLFTPPPYQVDFLYRHYRWFDRLEWLDKHLGALPLLRNMGDHFLIVMERRGETPLHG